MKRGTILVLGDPGPVRNDLLMRSDLEMLWMSRIQDALAVLRETTPNICLIGPELNTQDARQFMLTVAPRNLPCVLMVDPKQKCSVLPAHAAHAAAVIPLPQIESVLALVGFHTGLAFAKDARALIEASARVTILTVAGAEEYLLETANLSVSGVAIKGMPKCAAGTPVKLQIDLPFGTVTARAKVVRWSQDGSKQLGGLAFTELAMVDRERIQKLIESARRESPGLSVQIAELFGDITIDTEPPVALSTSDIHSSLDLPQVESLFDVGSELAILMRWAKTDAFDPSVPEWLQALARNLTPIEGVALVRDASPEWVMQAMRMRVCLARARAQCGEGRLPSVLSNGAYTTFVRLADCANGATPVVVAQVAKIRAALLRDLLGSSRMVRPGAGAAPQPSELGRDAMSSATPRV